MLPGETAKAPAPSQKTTEFFDWVHLEPSPRPSKTEVVTGVDTQKSPQLIFLTENKQRKGWLPWAGFLQDCMIKSG